MDEIDNKALDEIANAMERWHFSRDNDDETLKAINDILYANGYLKWFNEDNKQTYKLFNYEKH